MLIKIQLKQGLRNIYTFDSLIIKLLVLLAQWDIIVLYVLIIIIVIKKFNNTYYA